MFPIHEEVFKVLFFLVPTSILGTFLCYKKSGRRLRKILTWTFAFLSLLCMSFTIYFFRNPDREVNVQASGIIAPADGTIVQIKKVFENEYFKDDRIQVSIFMSPLNIHVNRSPVSGVLKYYKYYKGRYYVASLDKSSEMNEHNTIIVERQDGVEIMFRQIAGFMARRIAFFKNVNDVMKQGEVFGLIRFGSRVDLFLPSDAELFVKIGDKTVAGQTLLANVLNPTR